MWRALILVLERQGLDQRAQQGLGTRQAVVIACVQRRMQHQHEFALAPMRVGGQPVR